MWASYLFNRAKPKPLVLAQAVKLCHYIRASQRPSAEGSSLWETVYPLLCVLLSGVSCNVTFGVTWSLKLEKYRCGSRYEGRQWCESSSKAKPWRKVHDGTKRCCIGDMWPPTSRCRLCVLSMHRKGKKEEKYMMQKLSLMKIQERKQYKACSPRTQAAHWKLFAI